MIESTPLPITIDLGNESIDVLLDRFADTSIREGSYTLHEHAVYELCIVETGVLTLEVGGERVVLMPGEPFLIHARVPHRIIDCSDLLRFNLRFRFRSGNDPLDSEPFRKFGFDVEFLQLAHAIRIYAVPTTSLELCRLRANLTLLFCAILERSIASRKDFEKKFTSESGRLALFAEIDIFLVDNCTKTLTIADLAAHLGYSKMQTHRIVTECCGMPFSKKLCEIRMRRATELLLSSTLTIDEVAERCGYLTRSGFEAAFLRETGVRPAKLRQKIT